MQLPVPSSSCICCLASAHAVTQLHTPLSSCTCDSAQPAQFSAVLQQEREVYPPLLFQLPLLRPLEHHHEVRIGVGSWAVLIQNNAEVLQQHVHLLSIYGFCCFWLVALFGCCCLVAFGGPSELVAEHDNEFVSTQGTGTMRCVVNMYATFCRRQRCCRVSMQ